MMRLLWVQSGTDAAPPVGACQLHLNRTWTSIKYTSKLAPRNKKGKWLKILKVPEIPCALAYQILSSSITHTPNTVVEAIQIYIFQVELIHKKILSHTATTLEKYDSKIHWYSSHLLFYSRIFYNCYMLCCKKDSTMEGLKQE